MTLLSVLGIILVGIRMGQQQLLVITLSLYSCWRGNCANIIYVSRPGIAIQSKQMIGDLINTAGQGSKFHRTPIGQLWVAAATVLTGFISARWIPPTPTAAQLNYDGAFRRRVCRR